MAGKRIKKPQKKVSATHIISCNVHEGEPSRTALLIIYDNGDVNVRCSCEKCELCKYGELIKTQPKTSTQT
ncbi:MAG: hypothetical protein ACKD6O_02370 [Candidatus Bathyarchaeota archaeon]